MIIYIVINKINKKVYVGQTINSLPNRKKSHYYEMRTNRDNNHFHNALRKYGKNQFNWFILKKCENLEELDVWEKFYIKVLNSQNKKYGHNLTDGGKIF